MKDRNGISVRGLLKNLEKQINFLRTKINKIETTLINLVMPRDLGWAQYGDSQYIEASPLVITLGTTSTINLDGLANTLKMHLPDDVTDFYDTTTSKITPAKVGDGYTFSLSFKGKNTSNNGDATIFTDIGGSFTRLFPKTFRFNRGANVVHEYYFTFNMYTLDTFIANGGLLKIEAGTGNTSIYDIVLQIHRISKGKD